MITQSESEPSGHGPDRQRGAPCGRGRAREEPCPGARSVLCFRAQNLIWARLFTGPEWSGNSEPGPTRAASLPDPSLVLPLSWRQAMEVQRAHGLCVYSSSGWAGRPSRTHGRWVPCQAATGSSFRTKGRGVGCRQGCSSRSSSVRPTRLLASSTWNITQPCPSLLTLEQYGLSRSLLLDVGSEPL